MSRLSKQTIRRWCVQHKEMGQPHPMIHPFNPDKLRVHGVSSGLSHASYDASIAHDLVLGRHPGYVIKEWVLDHFANISTDLPQLPSVPGWLLAPYRVVRGFYKLLGGFAELAQRLRDEPPAYALAHTVEDFCMPPHIAGDVADKSTFARIFVSAYNTFFDPGFHGNATLELVNDSDKRVEYRAGMGVCQFIFTFLDQATESPYDGKYQGQTKQAHAARFESDEGGVANAGTHEVSSAVSQMLADGEHWANRVAKGSQLRNPDGVESKVNEMMAMLPPAKEAYIPLPTKNPDEIEKTLRYIETAAPPWMEKGAPPPTPETMYVFYRNMLDCAVRMGDHESGKLALRNLVDLVGNSKAAYNYHELYTKRDPLSVADGERIRAALDEAVNRFARDLPMRMRDAVKRRS